MSTVYLLLLALAAFGGYYIYRYSFSRLITDRGSYLDPNATIVGIRSEDDNWGRYKHIRTIVTFSDGSEYHTHKTRQEPAFGGYRIIVDAEVRGEIAVEAVLAHQKKVEKR